MWVTVPYRRFPLLIRDKEYDMSIEVEETYMDLRDEIVDEDHSQPYVFMRAYFYQVPSPHRLMQDVIDFQWKPDEDPYYQAAQPPSPGYNEQEVRKFYRLLYEHAMEMEEQPVIPWNSETDKQRVAAEVTEGMRIANEMLDKGITEWPNQ